MSEYRKQAKVADSLAATSTPNPALIPAYGGLAERYGLEDMSFQDDAYKRDQSVEQEYQGYVTAVLSPMSINILKFWEVRYLIHCSFALY
jgi:hypothetical protein